MAAPWIQLDIWYHHDRDDDGHDDGHDDGGDGDGDGESILEWIRMKYFEIYFHFCNYDMIPPVLQQIFLLCHFLQESAIPVASSSTVHIFLPFSKSLQILPFSAQIWQAQKSTNSKHSKWQIVIHMVK